MSSRAARRVHYLDGQLVIEGPLTAPMAHRVERLEADAVGQLSTFELRDLAMARLVDYALYEPDSRGLVEQAWFVIALERAISWRVAQERTEAERLYGDL